MRNDARILKYLEGELTSEEIITFENDVKNSSSLRKDFEIFLSLNRKLKDSKSVNLNQNYLDSILPEFRSKSNIKQNISVNRNIGYAFGVILSVIFSFIFFNNILKENSDLNSVKEFTESLDEMQKMDLLADLNGGQYDFNLISENITDLELTKLLQSELLINNEVAENYDIGYSDLVDELSQIEAEKIYNEILNENFSEEVDL